MAHMRSVERARKAATENSDGGLEEEEEGEEGLEGFLGELEAR